MTVAEQAPTARTAAIEQSGWGARFRLVQWRNAAFWVFLFGMAAGLVELLHLYGPQIGSYGIGIGSGVLLFGIYLVPWLFLLSFHNRHTALPPKLLLVAFLWGAVPATYLMGLPANTAIMALYGKLFGSAWAHDFAAGLTAPFTEETSKASALVLLLGLAPRLVRSPYDGLVIGAFAGLGLQISEDVLYSFNAAGRPQGVHAVLGCPWPVRYQQPEVVHPREGGRERQRVVEVTDHRRDPQVAQRRGRHLRADHRTDVEVGAEQRRPQRAGDATGRSGDHQGSAHAGCSFPSRG